MGLIKTLKAPLPTTRKKSILDNFMSDITETRRDCKRISNYWELLKTIKYKKKTRCITILADVYDEKITET